jgi:hypothetical protein
VALFLYLPEHCPSLRAWTASALVPSTAYALSSDHHPIKMDWNSAFLSSGIITSLKIVKPTINNTLTTPPPLVVNISGWSWCFHCSDTPYSTWSQMPPTLLRWQYFELYRTPYSSTAFQITRGLWLAVHYINTLKSITTPGTAPYDADIRLRLPSSTSLYCPWTAYTSAHITTTAYILQTDSAHHLKMTT